MKKMFLILLFVFSAGCGEYKLSFEEQCALKIICSKRCSRLGIENFGYSCNRNLFGHVFYYKCHCNEKFEEPSDILVSKYVVENTVEFIKSIGKCPYMEEEKSNEFNNRKPSIGTSDR